MSYVLNRVPVEELSDTGAQVLIYLIIGDNIIEEVIKSSDQMGGEDADSPGETMSSVLSEEKQEG